MMAGGFFAACSGPSANMALEDSSASTSDENSGKVGIATEPPHTVPAVAAATSSTTGLEPTPTTTLTLEPTPTATTPASLGAVVPQPYGVELKKKVVHYAPVVSRRLFAQWLTWYEFNQVWNGEITDWSELGEPLSQPVVRIGVEGIKPPGIGEPYDLIVPSVDDLAQELVRTVGGVAVIPRDQVDFRFRTLKINGLNPWRDPAAEHELTERIPFAEGEDPNNQPVAKNAMLLTVTGDVIFGRYVHKKMDAYGDFAAPFRSIYPELIEADVTLGDLECSLSDSFAQPEEIDPQTFLFKTWEKAVDGLSLAGYDLLSRANNHSFNFGPTGMDDTSRVLDAAGIRHFGMGHNLDEARRASIVEFNGYTYAFLGYDGISLDHYGAGPDWAGTAPMLDWIVREDIQRERNAGHIVIPYFHWGTEYVADPTNQQIYFAHLAIEEGAAMVLGSHPHWVQATETYLGRPIVYSLGNFVFDQAWSVETTQGLFAHIYLDGDRVREIDLVPVLIEDEHKPRRMAPYEGVPVMQRVWDATDRLG